MGMMIVMGVISMRGVGGVVAIDIRIAAKVFENLGTGEACDEGSNEGEEYDDLIHWVSLQPFMRLISSTAMEPRLRK